VRRCRIALDLCLIGTIIALGGCATTVNGTTERVRIDSKPQGATVRILPEDITITTPGEVDLARKHPHTLLSSLDGHVPQIVFIDRITSGAVYGNLLMGGLIGTSVDASSGGAFTLEPDELNIVFTPLPEPPPLVPAPPDRTLPATD
jgi:hypothetical protein